MKKIKMKESTNRLKKTHNMNETQIRWGIEDAAAVNIIFTQKIKPNGPAVANHPTFGAAGGKLCNGPPGRARSPGVSKPDRFLKPVRFETKTEPFPVLKGRHVKAKGAIHLMVDEPFESRIYTEYQKIINYKPNFKFITNIKNFKIMKKQILILAFFVLAMMAGSLSSFGQLLPGVTNPTGPNQPITPLACIATSEPLHPFAGVAYTYSLNNDSVAGLPGKITSANYTWWATQDPNFISTTGGVTTNNSAGALTVVSGALVAKGLTYGVTTPIATAGANSVSITWSADILSKTKYQAVSPADDPKKSTFVVGYSQGVGCADNMQVYEINPKPNFTIDIATIDTVTSKTSLWDAALTQCVDKVQSANYNTTSFMLDMDYGKNNFYFEIAGSNFVKNWTPTFTIISGLATTQEAVITLYKSFADAKTDGSELATSGVLTTANVGVGNGWATGLHLTATNIADAATGVSVYARVTIYNKTNESIDYSPFVLAVDAQDNFVAGVSPAPDTYGIWDMEDADCVALADAEDQVDRATENITPRPRLINNTLDGGAPNPTKTIPKPSTLPLTF